MSKVYVVAKAMSNTRSLEACGPNIVSGDCRATELNMKNKKEQKDQATVSGP